MKAEIITIGDEILIGQIVNTNSSWIAQQLNMSGIAVVHMASLSDQREAIIAGLQQALERADLILITGGLGPTKDDITKTTLADFFGMKMEIDKEILSDVESFFTKRGRPITQLNINQALVPVGAKAIRNPNGTAPGLWFTKDNKNIISMPGVPFEMKKMVTEDVIPALKKAYNLPSIYHKSILTQGLGESFLAEKIEAWEDSLGGKNIKLAYLPQPGMVRLRLSTSGPDMKKLEQNVNEAIEQLKPLISDYIYGYENYGEETPSIQKIVFEILRNAGKTLSIAESCTGGFLASSFTAIPGSSEVFMGGIVPYTNEAKHNLLQVDNSIFKEHGAVSKECVISLAENVIKKFNSNYSISVSGIAGPTGGTPEKPVGFVWIAVSNGSKTLAKSFQFGTDRQRNIVMTANTATDFLRKFVQKGN